MEWLQSVGTAALFTCLGVLGKALLDRRTEHEKIEITADEVNVKQQDASTKLLQAVSGVYDTLVKGLEERVAASEHAEADCRQQLGVLQAEQKASEERWEQRLKDTELRFQGQIANIHEMYRGGRRREDAD